MYLSFEVHSLILALIWDEKEEEKEGWQEWQFHVCWSVNWIYLLFCKMYCIQIKDEVKC